MEIDELLKNTSHQIHKRRIERGVGKSRLATALGTDRNLVDRWEKQKGVPSAFYLCKLADYFGCSIDALLGREE